MYREHERRLTDRHHFSAVVASFLGWISVGCAPQEPGSASFQAFDSAGVEIVTNETPLWIGGQDAWAVDSVPARVIASDSQNPTQTLMGVVDVVRLRDGRIVFGNSGTRELFVFGPNGNLQEVWGGAGEGPEEFDRILGVTRCGADTVMVQQGRRISLVGPNGDFLRVVRTIGNLVPHGFFDLEGVAGDCSSFLVAERGLPPPDPEEKVFRLPVHVYWAPTDGTPKQPVGSFPGVELIATLTDPPGVRRTNFGVSPSWTSDGESVYYGPGDRFEIQVLDQDGNLVRIIRWAGQRERISDEEWDRYSSERRRLIEHEPREEESTPTRREYSGSREKPAYSDLLIDDRGNLWVRQYSFPSLLGPDEGPERWWVLDQQGRWLGEIQTPAGFRTNSISGGYIIGVAKDDYDVSRVEIYEIKQ